MERRAVGGWIRPDGRAPRHARVVEARGLSGIAIHELGLPALLRDMQRLKFCTP